jgi:hypothetical protein
VNCLGCGDYFERAGPHRRLGKRYCDACRERGFGGSRAATVPCDQCGKLRSGQSVTGLCRSCCEAKWQAEKVRTFCKTCGNETRASKAYCSDACKPKKLSRVCAHCTKPVSGQRKTCSDECAKARASAGAIALRSSSRRQRRNADKKRCGYKGKDKAAVVARLLEAQDNRCKSCGDSGEDILLVLDHCHTTGVPRAMLCLRCNAALGQLKESPDRIKSLLMYAQDVCANVIDRVTG